MSCAFWLLALLFWVYNYTTGTDGIIGDLPERVVATGAIINNSKETVTVVQHSLEGNMGTKLIRLWPPWNSRSNGEENWSGRKKNECVSSLYL